MGFFAKLFQRKAREPRYIENNRIGYFNRQVSGVNVTPENALQVSTVWACCAYLSQTIGQLPWSVMVERDGHRYVVKRSLVHYLLHTRPSPEWSPLQFKETLVHWAVRFGNGYAEIERDELGRPWALHPIHPDRVHPMRDKDTDELYYEIVNDDGTRVELAAADMFHLRGFGDGPVGINVMRYAAESIGWARAVQLFGAAFFGNNMNIGGLVQVDGIGVDGKKILENSLNAKHRGPGRAWRWIVGDRRMDVKPFATKLNEGQFLETNQHMVEEICRWFRVPPHKVMHLLRAHFNNVEHLGIEVVVDSITPWVMRLEQEADYKLFGNNSQGFYTKLNMRALLRGDFKSQNEGFEIMRRNGVLNGDEWRDLVDMDPIGPSKGGDRYLVQAQMVDMNKTASREG
ncbi:phage portal protein [Ferrovibrio sp.]|uniref:phage portal protein n=1 Tax=Ferrovibrio sp. TaxID=1917215 RepID=UPI0035AEEE93